MRCAASQEKEAIERFKDSAQTLEVEWEIDVYSGLLNMIDREDSGLISLDKVP